MEQLKLFFILLKDSIRDLTPIIAVILVFEAFIIRSVPDNTVSIAIGLGIVAFGLAIFIQGLEVGIFPLGENLANDFVNEYVSECFQL